MNPVVSRAEVASALSKWQTGALSNDQIHAWANERFAVDAWDAEDCAVNEVLAQLDMMDMNLVTVEDVSALLSALEETSAEGAARIFATYSNTIDLASCKLRLKNEPFYSRFCI